MLSPQVVQRFAFQQPIRHDALRFGPIDDFPRFTDASVCRQIFSELGLEAAAAPNSLHENGLEGDGSGEIELRH
jgi:hypothetical protein